MPGRGFITYCSLGKWPRTRTARDRVGDQWIETGLVFTTSFGTALDAANMRRAFRKVLADTDLDETQWTPRELRHSFVSLLSSSGVAIEDIAHLVGHANTRTTEKVYRKELRPVLTRGAVAMDALFTSTDDTSQAEPSPPAPPNMPTE